ncbi:MAG: V-type ATP synthase subunit I [Clostridiales bacterium]|nr:V-type ATP synthase subunit I [Clostridiales bacterium]
MAVIDMKKVTLIGIERDKEKILKAIQSMGNLQISGFEEQNEEQKQDSIPKLAQDKESSRTLEEIHFQLTEVEFALELINTYSPVKKSMFDMKSEVEVHKLSAALDSVHHILKVVDECRKLEDELNELSLRDTRLINTISQMEPWQKLDVALDKLKDTATSRVLAGTVNRGATQRFLDSLKSLESDLLVVNELGETREDTCFFITYHKSIEYEISEVFKEFAFSKASFAGLEGTPSEIIDKTNKELNEIQNKRSEITQHIRGFADLRSDLELIYDALLIERDRYEAIQNLTRTDYTFVLKGWVPTVESHRFTETLRSETEDIYIKLEDPAADEDFPVALDNHPIITPFEMVTDLYSTPNSKELDPNIVMAPFFAIFFGIMMGDAAYGIIMAIAALWFLKKMKPKGNTKKLVSVIFIGGIFTFIWGAIFGGWFGNAGELAGIMPIWFNPSEEPIKMLIVCFAMGVIHIFAGMAVKAYANIREGRIMDAIFDQGLWYVFYIGLILWLIGGMANLGSNFVQIGQVMSIVGAIGLILTQGRDKENIFAKFFSGLLSLYDVTGFLSDVLSYSRLFALALTTGVIGTVMNQLGAMAGTSWYGWILAALILVVGHVFNIAINVLGAFVHTSRLQYIEFYGKFYEGGGKAFNPLSIRTKYSDPKNK